MPFSRCEFERTGVLTGDSMSLGSLWVTRRRPALKGSELAHREDMGDTCYQRKPV